MLPTGFANPFRAISTPVMNVVETAPHPTTIIPSLPFAGFTSVVFILFILICIFVGFKFLIVAFCS
jgi:hypothetical protein